MGLSRVIHYAQEAEDDLPLDDDLPLSQASSRSVGEEIQASDT